MNITAPEIAHGWTTADVDRVVRWALTKPHTQVASHTDRYEIAWSAAALALAEATEPPSRRDLRGAAWRALGRLGEEELRHAGKWRDGSRRWQFDAYWLRVTRAPDPADAAADRDIARRYLSLVTPAQRAALLALAEHDDYGRAGEALGIAAGTVKAYVATARHKIRAAREAAALHGELRTAAANRGPEPKRLRPVERRRVYAAHRRAGLKSWRAAALIGVTAERTRAQYEADYRRARAAT